MAMLLSLLPCLDCPSLMRQCHGCTHFFKWLNVAIVHQGRTKGFLGAEGIIGKACEAPDGWGVSNVVLEYFRNELSNAERIWEESKKEPGATEVEYTGKKPSHGPASVFKLHHDEQRRLTDEYLKNVIKPEQGKADRGGSRNDRKLAISADELLGPMGAELTVDGRPIRDFVVVKYYESAG